MGGPPTTTPTPADALPDVLGGVRDAVLKEILDEAMGGSATDRVDEFLQDHGFERVDSADAEAEYKNTASKSGEVKLKKVLGNEQAAAKETTVSLWGLQFQMGGKLKTKTGIVEVKPGARAAEVNAIELEAEGYLARFDGTFDGEWKALAPVTELRPIVFASPGPFAARVGDPMLHGGVAAPGPGSPDVIVGGLPALRALDTHVCSMATPIPHGPGIFVGTATDVLINGRPAVRAGDFASEMVGPNPVVMGCATVTMGTPPPPLQCHQLVSVPRHLVEWDGAAGIDFGYAIAKVKAGVGIEPGEGFGPQLSGEVDASVFRPWAKGSFALNIPVNIDVDLPFLGRVRRDTLTLRSQPELEARVLTAGADGSLRPGGGSKGKPGAAIFKPGKWKAKNSIDLTKGGK